MFIHGGKGNSQYGGPAQVRRHPAAQSVFDPGSRQQVEGCPTPPTCQHVLHGHLEELRL